MAFYLGRKVDGAEGDEGRVAYKPKHLTTHGLILGMTGSGKTGLAIGVLEEAARADIPVIAIDPKGDLTNLALSWPDLEPAHFAEWVDASRLGDGADRTALGEAAAKTWRDGLARDGLGPDEIRELRARTHVAVYTPGSSAGVQVSLLERFDPPPRYAELTAEDASELVEGVVSAILALVEIDADPLHSREYILLSAIIGDAWSRGETLDLPGLIQAVASPPVQKLGVFELDQFFPPKKREAFAMQLNALVASPSFKAWLGGIPLDIDALLRRDARGSRVSIFSIAHLDDAERMSFVSLLLDKLIGWMRAQPGTGDLRALLYFDEVFGYLPPHPKNPPTKRPLLTILKQARAFGLGALLATQNPVDIDYKAITNAGTWFIGKLQTEQDKDRMLDGLMGAAAGANLSRADISRRISALEGRQFLLQNAHDPEQIVFKTRFAMSYLRGPMTKHEIARLDQQDYYNLDEARQIAAKPFGDRSTIQAPPASPQPPSGGGSHDPARDRVVAARFDAPSSSAGEVVEISPSPSRAPSAPSGGWGEAMLRGGGPAQPSAPTTQARSSSPTPRGFDARYLSREARRRPEVQALLGLSPVVDVGTVHYRPALLARVRMSFTIEGVGVVPVGTASRVAYPLPETPGAIAWMAADVGLPESSFASGPEPGATHTAAPRWLSSPAERDRAFDLLTRGILAAGTRQIPVCRSLGRFGEPGESLDDFRGRLALSLRAKTDASVERVGGRRDSEAAMWDRQLSELRELLEMDKREIAWLRDAGDADRLERATFMARHRMGQYKDLKAQRDKFMAAAERELADVEFEALDHLDACELVSVHLSPKGIQSTFFGLLWV